MKLIIYEISAYTHIIGKISEENHSYTIIPKSNVITGGLDLTSIITEKGVQMSIIVIVVMAGKNRSIIQKIINSILVNMENSAINHIAHIIIPKKIEDSL